LADLFHGSNRLAASFFELVLTRMSEEFVCSFQVNLRFQQNVDCLVNGVGNVANFLAFFV
jgi:hypothetical protein